MGVPPGPLCHRMKSNPDGRFCQVKLYKLPFVMRGPCEETEDKFMAEIPALPGCRAWGDTYDEAVENVQSVAAAFIESYAEWGDELPPEVVAR